MNDDFQKIAQKLPELLSEFANIQNSTQTVRQAIREIAATLQKAANLYEVRFETLEGGSRIHDSVFGKNEEVVQDYLRHLPPPRPYSNTETVLKILKGEIVIGSSEQEVNPSYFNSAPFPLTASWIFLPIKRKGQIFGVLSLGSEKIIPRANYKEDFSESKAFRLPFETLLSKIDQIIDSKHEIG